MTRRKHRKLEKGIRYWKGGLQAYIRVHGELYSETFHLNDPAALEKARAWRLKTKRQHFGGGPSVERGSFAAYIAVYVKRVAAKPTIKQITAHLNLWAQELGRDRSPLTITDTEIDIVMQKWLTTPSRPNYAAQERGRPSGADGIDPQTVRKRRNTLRTFFAVMFPKDPNPVQTAQNFAAGKAEVRGTDYATIARILDAMPDYHSVKNGLPPTRRSLAKLRAHVIAYTGLPPGLLGQVRRPDVTLTTTPATVRIVEREKGEGVEARTLVLTERGREAFAAFDAADAYGAFNPDPLNRSFRRACRRVGVTGLTIYDLRHSFGAQLYRATGDLATVGRMLLHAEGSPMTARYAKAGNADVDAAAAAAFSASVAHVPVASVPAPLAKPSKSCPRKLSPTGKQRERKHLRVVG